MPMDHGSIRVCIGLFRGGAGASGHFRDEERRGGPFKPLPQKTGSDHAGVLPLTKYAGNLWLEMAWSSWDVPQRAEDCTIKHGCKPVEAEAIWDGVNRNGPKSFNAPIPGALEGRALIDEMLEVSIWGNAMPAVAGGTISAVAISCGVQRAPEWRALMRLRLASVNSLGYCSVAPQSMALGLPMDPLLVSLVQACCSNLSSPGRWPLRSNCQP